MKYHVLPQLRFASLLISSVILSGCAGVAFYKTPQADVHAEVGFPIYPPKPYFLVSPPDKDGNQTVSIVTLPDLSDPHYVKSWEGLGTANMSYSLTNGALTTWNATTDSKLPEVITALTGGVAGIKTANAALTTAAASAAAVGNQGSSAAEYQQQGRLLGTLAKSLKTTISAAVDAGRLPSEATALADDIAAQLTEGAGDIDSAARNRTLLTNAPAVVGPVIKMCKSAANSIDSLKSELTVSAGNDAVDRSLGLISSSVITCSENLAALLPKVTTSTPKDFKLYHFEKQSDGTLKLVEVPF
jgi:hypothetical protein